MMELHCKSARVWYAMLRDHTILPATHAFILKWNEQPKLILVYRLWRDGRLSWPRHCYGK